MPSIVEKMVHFQSLDTEVGSPAEWVQTLRKSYWGRNGDTQYQAIKKVSSRIRTIGTDSSPFQPYVLWNVLYSGCVLAPHFLRTKWELPQCLTVGTPLDPAISVSVLT